MKAEEYDDLSRESTPLEASPSPRGGAARQPSKMQERQAMLNTFLLLLSALFLAILAARGGDGDAAGPGSRRTLANAVPGLPPQRFLDDDDDDNWQEIRDGAAPMPLWHHLPTGRVWADVAACLDVDMLFVEQLTQGVGIRQSPAYGGLLGSWDAGRPLGQNLVQFRREGPKILLVALETVHRASDPDVQSSVEQSFAPSVLWSFATHEYPDTGTIGIDLTEFVLRDARGGGLVADLNSFGGA